MLVTSKESLKEVVKERRRKYGSRGIISRNFSRYPDSIEVGMEKVINSVVNENARQLNQLLLESKLFLRHLKSVESYTDSVTSASQLNSIFVNVESTADRRIETIVTDFDNIFNLISRSHFQRLESNAKTSLGVDIFLRDRELTSLNEEFIFENTQLIKDVSKKQLRDIQKQVSLGVRQGLTNRFITKKVMEKTKLSKKRAKLIARDQVASANSNISQSRARELGIKKFIWVTSLDERVRRSHVLLHNKKFTYKKGAKVDGDSFVFPGGPINCRCVDVPDFESLLS